MRRVVLVIIIFLLVGGILIYKSVFSDWSVDDYKTEEIIKTDLGDNFLFKYEYSDFPDSQTTVYILNNINNQKIARFIIEDKVYKADLLNILNTSKIRCYVVFNKLLYSVNSENFEYIDIDQINECNPEEYRSLVQSCKALVNLNEWKWVKACAKFLMNSGDSDIVNRIQNYAEGNFTQEEIDKNKYSEITQKDIQSYSKTLLDTK